MSQDKQALPPRTAARRSSRPGSPKKAGKPKKKASRLRKVLLALMATLMGVLFIIAGVLIYLVFQTSDAVKSISMSDPKATVVPVKESVKEKPVAIAVLGIDSRPGGGGLNTDVMMVAVFNPSTKKATIVSIPRDTYIEATGYRGRKANSYYASFYNVGRKEKGMDADAAKLEGKRVVREVLGEWFGIEIKYAAMINFQGFIDVVDALGGVKVNVDMRMKYTDSHDNTNIDLQKGEQVLYGKDALDFVRYRQSNDNTNMSNDFERNQRQRDVVSGLVDKLMSLGGIAKIGSVFEAVSDNVSTDMPVKEITRMMETYYLVRGDDIDFMAVDGTWQYPYVRADADSLAKARAALQSAMAQ